MPNLRFSGRALRLTAAGLVAGSLVVGSAGTAHAVVADQPRTSFPDFNDTVEVVVHRGATVYVGGAFTSVTDSTGKTVTRRHAAAFDANTGRVRGWNPDTDGDVLELAVFKRGVYVGGDFGQVRGHTRHNLALVTRGTGAAKKGFHPNVNKPVEALALSKRTVYVGGEFTKVGTKFRAHLAAFSRASAKLRAWSPRAGAGQVSDLARVGRSVYVGGSFTSLNGSTGKKYFGRVTAGSGKLVKSFDPDAKRLVRDLAVTKTRIYAGLGGRGGGGVLAVTRGSGAHVFYRRFDGDVEAVTTLGKNVYAGGHFNHVCATKAQSPGTGKCLDPGAVTRRKGASLGAGGGKVTGWDPNFNSPLGVVDLDRYKSKGRLLVGGHFDQAKGTHVGHFAVFD